MGYEQREEMRRAGFLVGRQEVRKQSSDLDPCGGEMYDLQADETVKTEV